MPYSKQRRKDQAKHHTLLREKDEETKEIFYSRLQTVLDKMKEKDMTILMGDFNAKIGANNTRYEEVIGQTRTRHENGAMFADLSTFNISIIIR